MSMQNKDYPIDAVIIWVDGSDPEWLLEKKKYSPTVNTDDRVSRYRDWDNLQYIFRGVEKFAPWVNNIFFVTWGHVPKWLNTNAPKLKIVNHKDFIPDEYLPTFSSHTIELNFHRIAGLSEHFIYFNDDMFLTNYTRPEDFFKDGKPCDSAVLTAHSHVEDKFFLLAQYRAAGLVNKYFNMKEVIKTNRRGWFNLKYGKMLFRSWVLSGFPRFTGFWPHHLPTSLCKSTMIELWEKECGKLHETCLNRFRQMLDFNQWLFKDWQLAANNFYPRSVKFGRKFDITSEKMLNEAVEYLVKQKGKAMCINDNDWSNYLVDDEEFARAKKVVTDGFDKILPDKSRFEN